MSAHKQMIWSSLGNLQKWLEDNHYKGYDPADGLTSYLRPLTFGNLFLDRLLQQLIWRSPFNLRRLLGVRKLDSFIGRGYIARAYLTLYGISREIRYSQKALVCLDWLMLNKAPGYEHFSWGKMFDFASRSGWQRRREPITVWTSLIGHAFIDAYETLGQQKYLNVAASICEWVLGVPRTITGTGACINYTPLKKGTDTIHNQSMLAAALLARTAKYTLNQQYLDVARQAVQYTCTRQLSNGAWHYGEDPTYHWIDNFHSGYVLDSLKSYIGLTQDDTYADKLRLGFSFYKESFIEDNGRPKYYHNRPYPIDSQCAAQTIDTLALFSDIDDSALELATRVAKWTIINMQDPSGYFYFARYPGFVLKAPMIHWAQASTFKALAHLLSKL